MKITVFSARDNTNGQTRILTSKYFLYYGDVLNQMFVVSEVPGSVLEPLDFLLSPIYYLPVTVRSKPFLFSMSVLSIEISTTTTLVSHYKMT